ncbi:MAG: GFA family protein [Alphaproteobacteria bacterium]
MRYEVGADPIMIYACHCTICQRQSGSAFGMAVVFPGSALKLTGAKPSHFVRQGHGRRFRCYFCPACGSRIYHQWFTDEGDYPFLSIKPGTLDDTTWVRPGCHVWTQHAQPWIRFTDEDVAFRQQPSLDEMPRFKSS